MSGKEKRKIKEAAAGVFMLNAKRTTVKVGPAELCPRFSEEQ